MSTPDAANSPDAASTPDTANQQDPGNEHTVAPGADAQSPQPPATGPYAPVPYPLPGYSRPSYRPPAIPPPYSPNPNARPPAPTPQAVPGPRVPWVPGLPAPRYTAPGSAAPGYARGPYAGPAQPPAGAPPVGAPPRPGFVPPRYAPAPKPSRSRRVLLIAAVVAILAVMGAGMAYVIPKALHAGSHTTTSTATPSGSASPAQAGPSAAMSGGPPPDPKTVAGLLDIQSAALIAGDHAAFLSGIDAAKPSVIAAYQRIYHNMRAMKATEFSQRALYAPPLSATPQPVDVTVTYCLLVTDCSSTTASFDVTVALKGGKATIESFTVPGGATDAIGPLPWEVTTLSAVTAPRIVVAAGSDWSPKLTYALGIAEKAAKADDPFARWGKPAVYVIYLAGKAEADKWYGGGLQEADGVTYTISPFDLEVVADMPYADEVGYAGPGRLGTVLQHEMGHVVTLQGSRNIAGDDFVEGIAEYCAYNGHVGWASYRLADVRAYIKAGKWSHQAYLRDEIHSTDGLTGSAAYGIGYLTMLYLAQTYGKDRMLDFWGEVERDDESLDEASQAVLGKPWSSVNDAAVTYIENEVGA